MKPRRVVILAMLCCLTLLGSRADAFCGFYVGKADSKLYNEASKVVLVRDGNRTVITMANDYQGELTEFAMVIPVPTFIERDQIHVTRNAIIDHLDAFTSPRLVEYFDEDPCRVLRYEALKSVGAMAAEDRSDLRERDIARSLGVTIEAEYTVGEYDILILSAQESSGLETWLRQSGYKIPEGASRILQSYIKQGMRFFVAKVNLEEQSKTGTRFLNPLSIAFESPKFMLPIRLGTVNARGTQELFVFAITRNGRVETTNYRTVKLPSGNDLPLFVKDEFGEFYTAMFDEQVRRQGMKSVFLEYAWNLSWCDPCAADPLSRDELAELGVFWLAEGARGGQAQNAYVTRLHLRYDAEHFPEDLVFQETGDQSNFQGRYVLRHPWTGSDDCEQARAYLRTLPARFSTEAQTLANLTGWDYAEIQRKMRENGQVARVIPDERDTEPWWKRIWDR